MPNPRVKSKSHEANKSPAPIATQDDSRSQIRRTRRLTPKVGLAIELDNFQGREMLHGILEYVARHPEWQIPVYNNLPYVPKNQLGRWEGDGIIGAFFSLEQIDRLLKLNIPIVNLSGSHVNRPLIANIDIDDREIGRIGARHLLDLGHRHLLFAGDEHLTYSRLRHEGFVEIATKAKRGHSHFQVKAHPDRGQLTNPTLYVPLLKQIENSTGILAASDRIGFGLLAASKELEIDVPGKVAVLGCNDDDVLCPLATPPLSSIDTGASATGYAAAAMLDFMMGRQSEPPEQTIVSPGHVHVRASTDGLASGNTDLLLALRFIRTHARGSVYVPDIVQATKLSRRTVENLFRDHLGRSIAEEIRRVRVEIAEELLCKTDHSLNEVAIRAGFPTRTALDLAFTKAHQCSPSEFRSIHMPAT